MNPFERLVHEYLAYSTPKQAQRSRPNQEENRLMVTVLFDWFCPTNHIDQTPLKIIVVHKIYYIKLVSFSITKHTSHLLLSIIFLTRFTFQSRRHNLNEALENVTLTNLECYETLEQTPLW